MSNENSTTIVLPAAADLPQAATLKQQLEAVAGEAVAVDASQVQRISTLCLQVILAAARQGTVTVADPSPAFLETVSTLGLKAPLGL